MAKKKSELDKFRELLDSLERAYFDMCNSTRPDSTTEWRWARDYQAARVKVEIAFIQILSEAGKL